MLSPQQIEAGKAALCRVAMGHEQKQAPSRLEIVEAYLPEIVRMRKARASWKTISKAFASSPISCKMSPWTMRDYYTEARKNLGVSRNSPLGEPTEDVHPAPSSTVNTASEGSGRPASDSDGKPPASMEAPSTIVRPPSDAASADAPTEAPPPNQVAPSAPGDARPPTAEQAPGGLSGKEEGGKATDVQIAEPPSQTPLETTAPRRRKGFMARLPGEDDESYERRRQET